MKNITPRSAWSAVAARLEAVERSSSIYAGSLGKTRAKTLAGADEATAANGVDAISLRASYRPAIPTQ